MKSTRNKYNDFIKYSGMGMQMILTIVAGTFGGKYLDGKVQMGFPVFTLLGVLLSVFGAVYLAIREFLKK